MYPIKEHTDLYHGYSNGELNPSQSTESHTQTEDQTPKNKEQPKAQA